MNKHLFEVLITGCLVTLLSGCSSDNGSSSIDVDTTAPAASITFPTAVSATEGNSITVRGTATDTSEITVVRVNGIDATSNDNFATWQATLALTPGVNNLTVETGDIALNTNMETASGQINAYGPAFSAPVGVVLDSANNRALVIDQGLDALVAVDLATGARTIVSNSGTPDAVNAFVIPRSMVHDSATNRALVVDSALNALVVVDLVNGQRVFVSR